ncbi:hypothetical protein [Haloprofundus halobius]|uniref:hypothetical protein n=1 Tax=Haloprofundus halobius TaxID=2876194 RepID=UPI001CCC5DDF|nr:hypothetical protein [Haloprofundus halobius]
MTDPVQQETRSSAAPDADRQSSDDADDDHLSDLEDGVGCTEIWEHLSERRAEASARSTERAEE